MPLSFLRYIIITLGLVICFFIAKLIGEGEWERISIYLAFFLGLLWVAFARERWWVCLPATNMLAGSFQFIFKIFPHEIGLAICILAALPSYIYKKNRITFKIPLPIKFLLAYLFLHCIGSIFYSNYIGIQGLGNIVRGYMWGLWPLIFSVVFFKVGDPKSLKITFFLMFLLGFIQGISTFLSSFYGISIIIPGINLTLSVPQNKDAVELTMFDFRWIAVNVVVLNLCLISVTRGLWRCLAVFAFPITLFVLILGGGRAALLAGVLYIILWLIANRRFFSFFFVLFISLIIIVSINLEPSYLKFLPYQIERPLSGFVIDERYAEQNFGGGLGSNDWHRYLREIAFTRWTTSPTSLIIGYGVRPFEQITTGYAPEQIMYFYALSAANTGAYEKSLWTILAVTGLVGLCLYLWVIIFYFRYFFRYLSVNAKLKTLKDVTIWWAASSLVVTVITSGISGGFIGFPFILSAIALKILLVSDTSSEKLQN